VLETTNFEPGTVQRVVEFLYTGDHNEVDNAKPEAECSQQGTAENGGAALHFVISSLALTVLPEDPSQSTSEATESSSNGSPVNELLLMHVYANSIGDYYGVGELVTLATMKLEQVLMELERVDEDTWIPGLPGVVGAANEAARDAKLLSLLAETVEKKLPTLLSMNEFLNLDVRPFAVQILRHCANAKPLRQQRLRIYSFTLRSKIDGSKRNSGPAKSARSSWKDMANSEIESENSLTSGIGKEMFRPA
jgi:hypothetical protein